MKPTDVINTLEMFWNVNKRSVRLVGAPGVGKTSLVKDFAKRVDARYQHLHGPTKQVEDFGVLNLMTDDIKFDYKMPEWWPTDPEEPVVICIDDGSQMGADLQKVEANIKQERELHGHILHDSVMLVSTGNRVEDRAGVVRQLSHSANRETQIHVDVSLQDWSRWAMDNNIPVELTSFMQFRPNLLHDFSPDRALNATPRSWVDGVAPYIGKCPGGTEYEVFAGAVGEGPGGEFTSFLQIWRDLPNPDAVILNPDGYDVPTEPATKYALVGALAEKTSSSNFDRVITAMSRIPGKEFGVLGVTLATRRDPTLTTTNAFTKWAVENQDVLF